MLLVYTCWVNICLLCQSTLSNNEVNFSQFLVYLFSYAGVYRTSATEEGDFFHHHHHEQRKVETIVMKERGVRYNGKCGLTKHSSTLFEELLR